MKTNFIRISRDVLALFIEEIQDYTFLKKDARRKAKNPFTTLESENSQYLEHVLILD